MPSINLIAARREEKRRQEQSLRRLLGAVMGEVGAVVGVGVLMSLQLAGIHHRIGDYNAQIQKLEPKVSQIATMQDATAKITPKVATLDSAKADTLFWYSNLCAVTNSLPPQTWLSSIGTTGNNTPSATPGAASGADPTMAIAGTAASQDAVGQTMLRMNQSPNLDHVDLAFVQQQVATKDTPSTVTFQMTVHLKPEAAAAAPAGKGASNVQKS